MALMTTNEETLQALVGDAGITQADIDASLLTEKLLLSIFAPADEVDGHSATDAIAELFPALSPEEVLALYHAVTFTVAQIVLVGEAFGDPAGPATFIRKAFASWRMLAEAGLLGGNGEVQVA